MSVKSKIESILFISPRPLTIKKIAELLSVEEERVKEVLDELVSDYNNRQEAGLQINRLGKQYQMSTAPANQKIVKDFIKEEITGDLTRPQLETLTVIAYRGPIAKEELEQIRGVNCSLILRNLLIRGLIAAEEDKKSMRTYYFVTFDFLRFLGLSAINQLPDYDKLHSSEVIERLIAEKSQSEKLKTEG
jgi:segregation and condensation protein B